MHQTIISQGALDIAKDAYGERAALRLDPRTTVHIIVDLQEGFVAPSSPLATPNASRVVANVNRLARTVRDSGGINIFLRFTYDASWTKRYERLVPSLTKMMREGFSDGAELHNLWKGLDVQPEDVVLNKTRLSAFTPGTCALASVLKDRGVDTLIITGCSVFGCDVATTSEVVARLAASGGSFNRDRWKTSSDD